MSLRLYGPRLSLRLQTQKNIVSDVYEVSKFHALIIKYCFIFKAAWLLAIDWRKSRVDGIVESHMLYSILQLSETFFVCFMLKHGNLYIEGIILNKLMLMETFKLKCWDNASQCSVQR